MIVPRSSQLITEDQDFRLYNVTLFKKVVEEFKLHAREKKFVVREFTYNEEELAAGKNEITKLVTDKKKQFVSCFDLYFSSENHQKYFYSGTARQMVEGELQRMLLCLGSCESTPRFRRIRFKVKNFTLISSQQLTDCFPSLGMVYP